jgi:hypothetical protein
MYTPVINNQPVQSSYPDLPRVDTFEGLWDFVKGTLSEEAGIVQGLRTVWVLSAILPGLLPSKALP